MMNGAFFVPSGEGATMQYAKASSVSPKSANQIDQLTMNAGVLGGPRYTHTQKHSFYECLHLLQIHILVVCITRMFACDTSSCSVCCIHLVFHFISARITIKYKR